MTLESFRSLSLEQQNADVQEFARTAAIEIQARREIAEISAMFRPRTPVQVSPVDAELAQLRESNAIMVARHGEIDLNDISDSEDDLYDINSNASDEDDDEVIFSAEELMEGNEELRENIRQNIAKYRALMREPDTPLVPDASDSEDDLFDDGEEGDDI